MIYVVKRSEPITTPAPTDASQKKAAVSAAVPIVCYRGERSRCDIAGLEPNSLYHFRLRYLGPRSNSQLSAPLVLMTAPLPLSSPPVLIKRGSKTVWIKWYPAPHGAFKFLVQLKADSSASSSINSTASAAAGGGGADGGWKNVFNGPSTDWRSTTLSPDTSYSVRIVGVNCQGAQSDPSPVLRFKTLSRDEKEQLTPRNASENFVIECTGDICVGDTILITERLYEKSSAATADAAPVATTASTALKRSSLAQGLSVVRMDMSVMSTGTGRGSQATAQLGAYLGERTIAAFVTMDNHKTLKKANSSTSDQQLSLAKLLKSRRLHLEVVWQKVSSDACKQFDLKPGVTVERSQSHLEQFEIYRCRWEQEDGRRPFRQEAEDLADCFIALNC